MRKPDFILAIASVGNDPRTREYRLKMLLTPLLRRNGFECIGIVEGDVCTLPTPRPVKPRNRKVNAVPTEPK